MFGLRVRGFFGYPWSLTNEHSPRVEPPRGTLGFRHPHVGHEVGLSDLHCKTSYFLVGLLLDLRPLTLGDSLIFLSCYLRVNPSFSLVFFKEP